MNIPIILYIPVQTMIPRLQTIENLTLYMIGKTKRLRRGIEGRKIIGTKMKKMNEINKMEKKYSRAGLTCEIIDHHEHPNNPIYPSSDN